MRTNLEHAWSEAVGQYQSFDGTFSTVRGPIYNFIFELGAIVLRRYGVLVGSLTFDFDLHLRLRTRSSHRSVVATKPTPA